MRSRLGVIAGGIVVGVAAVSLAGCGGGSGDQPGATALPPPPPPTSTTPKLVVGSPTYDKIVKRGKLVVGLAEAPGLAARQPDGGYGGFEVEIGRLLAGKLGLQEQDVLFKALPAGLRRDAVADGDVDVQIGGLTSGSAEQGKLAVAGPYLTTPPALLTKSGGGVDSVRGKQVCVPKDSAALAALQQDGLTLRVGDTLADCRQQLDAGSVAAVADDAAALLGLAAQPGGYHATPLPGADTQHDVGVPYQDKAFRAKLNEILRAAVQSGDWQQRFDRTLGTAGVHLPPPTPSAPATSAPASATPTPTG